VLDGALDLDLAVAGTLDDPRLEGDVALSDGRYENLDLGTILTRLELASRIEEDGALALSLEARDGADGTVTAEAGLGLAEGRVEAALASDGAILVRRDDATAAVTLDIRAAGPLSGPDIEGEVRIDRAEIRLVNATPPSVTTLGDVRIKGAPRPEETEPAGSAIGLDIRIRADRNIFVRGRGLDSEWQMALDVSGTAARPRITGAVERVRGGLTLIGTRFGLETGEVRFTGGPEIDPRLDVRLQAEENGVTGGVRVTGRASDPQIGFWSRQGLPEGEVMPRLLFGKPSQSLTPGQAVRLASGLAVLFQGSGGFVDRARGAVGLDVLAIDPTEEGADLTVGKNVSDDVFVGAKQSLDGQETSVTVEVEVFENVTVDSEVDPTGDASVGVNWRKDF
jgi:autotransporter translocation and assembly factor TamB